MPVVEARKALSSGGADNVTIKVDNYTAVQNLNKMADGLGYGCSYFKVSDTEYDVTLTQDPATALTAASEVSAGAATLPGSGPARPEGAVVAIGGDVLGSGAEDLGRILMKAFVYSLTEQETPPAAVLFFNSGAKLTSGESTALSDLRKLHAAGTRILTCGTCVDYYGLPAPAVGETANMFEIAGLLTGAARLVCL